MATVVGGSSTRSVNSGPGDGPRHAVADYDGDDYELGDDADDDDTAGPTDSDGDTDNPAGTAYDSDDLDLADYGHLVDVREKRRIAAVVRRYFLAAAAVDGGEACSMIPSSIVRLLPRTFTGVTAPPYERAPARTCAEVVDRMFRFYHAQVAREASGVYLARVGILGSDAVVVLSFPRASGLPARVIRLQRQGGVWKINGVLDNELP